MIAAGVNTMTDELGVEAGQTIAGRYRLVELLGRGGMGSVWRCDHLSLMSQVALKVIKPEVARSSNSVARFMREAKAAALLRSPHVVQILDHGSEGDIAYIAMELLEGESLLQRIKRLGALGPTLTATVLTHIGRAMQKAHDAGIIHRDLKPDNVFLVDNDDEVLGKVLDFGIAKTALATLDITGESPQTQTGALLGTPYYMSPEQATGQKDIDHRADLWAMGVIAYECLLGSRPYQSDSLGALLLQICSREQPVPSDKGPVPEGFDAWFRQAQARDREARFHGAKDMVRELRTVLARPLVHPSQETVGGLPAGGLPGGAKPASSATPLAGTPDAVRLAAPPVSDTPTHLIAGLEQRDAATGGAAAVAANPSNQVEPTAADAHLETFEPVSRAATPARRSWLMAVAAVLLTLLGALIGLRVMGDDPASEIPAAATSALPASSDSEPSASVATVTGSAEDLSSAAPTVSASAAAPQSSASASTASPPATGLRPRSTRTVAPPRPTTPPPRTKPPDDPLGI